MPNIRCSNCDHRWFSDKVPQRCPNRECNSRKLEVSELPGEPPVLPKPEKPSESPASAKTEHPLEVASRKAREEAGAALCLHDKWSYPKGHADYQWGCPACIELAKPKSDLAAKAFIAANEATVKAGKK